MCVCVGGGAWGVGLLCCYLQRSPFRARLDVWRVCAQVNPFYKILEWATPSQQYSNLGTIMWLAYPACVTRVSGLITTVHLVSGLITTIYLVSGLLTTIHLVYGLRVLWWCGVAGSALHPMSLDVTLART